MRGVDLRVLVEGIDTRTPGGRLLFEIAGAFAEYERSLIRSRTREGLEAVRRRGARIGRPSALNAEQQLSAQHVHEDSTPVTQVAHVLGCSEG
ncbi:recombinase family protein [Schaalia radingae]|uniref:recombinase family protein n=1 Tax=Schaalia radingae TaxID=131110 RepID=UPI0012FFB401